MLPPHGIKGAHQAGEIPPLSKDWSKPGWMSDIMKIHSAVNGWSYRKHWDLSAFAHVESTWRHNGLKRESG
jgi:hypothetical protein